MTIYCLDAEFAENEELLELSVFSLEGKEVYHSYYKPERIEDWRTDIHHITPEMVADKPTFTSKVNEVETFLGGADVITGFAVNNDLRVLSRSGVEGLDKVCVLDVKDMFWYMKGRGEGMSPFAVPSLIVCAQALGMNFGEDVAHSASADTRATVESFNILMNLFMEAEKPEAGNEIALFVSHIDEAKKKFIEEGAKGFVSVLKVGDVYKLKVSHLPKDASDKSVVVEVAVADRYLAEYELRKMLKKKEVPGKQGFYRLNAKQLDDIRAYTNEYDAEQSAWCKKVVRNLGRLSL